MASVMQERGDRENLDGAREYLMDAASLDPSDAEPLFQLGQLYLEADQPRYAEAQFKRVIQVNSCLLYTSPSPRDRQKSRMPSSA